MHSLSQLAALGAAIVVGVGSAAAKATGLAETAGIDVLTTGLLSAAISAITLIVAEFIRSRNGRVQPTRDLSDSAQSLAEGAGEIVDATKGIQAMQGELMQQLKRQLVALDAKVSGQADQIKAAREKNDKLAQDKAALEAWVQRLTDEQAASNRQQQANIKRIAELTDELARVKAAKHADNLERDRLSAQVARLELGVVALSEQLKELGHDPKWAPREDPGDE